MTHRLALDWLTVRHDTSPRTRNTHLLVTDHSASSAVDPMVAAMTVRRIFRDIGVRASQLRQDRILDEAALTADPVHLMRLFGVSTNTAMRYVSTQPTLNATRKPAARNSPDQPREPCAQR